MVARTQARRGASALGCLFAIMIVAVVLYYGVDLGRTYFRYYHLKDEMESSARFAQTQSDEQILRHLGTVAQDLGLPAEARRFVIQRTQHPPTVIIRTQYRVTLVLPFKHKVLLLKPEVEVRQ